MLDVKKHRLDYGAMLIPPPGFRLTKAVAATYSLDLNTLLSIPVALFFSQTLEGNFEAERVQLLEAIQRCPDVLRVYHQAGKIHVPRKHNRLYGLLEPCVVGILPNDAFTAFHPKVWVLRYEHDTEPTQYRVIVLSRNLTYDRSWDIAAHLDGDVTKKEQAKSQPLVSFVRHLMSYERFDGDSKFIAELGKVDFQSPDGFNGNFFFHPVGIDEHPNPIQTNTGSRAICISPFVHDETIRALRKNVTDDFLLFGCREELRTLDPQTLTDVRTFCISDLIVDGESLEKGEDGDGEQCEQNLHAKLYVFQRESSSTAWFLGSANATKAAFERNIEFLLELRGSGAAVQLDRLKNELLGEDEKGGIFQEYVPPTEPFDDSEERQLEENLRLLEFNLLKYLDIQAEVAPLENKANYDLHLILDPGSSTWHDLTVKVSPFNSDGIELQELASKGPTTLVFQNINESNLSRFLRFEIWQGAARKGAFLMKVEIKGLPESRVSRILRSIINSRDRFFEYLRFLLADDLSKEPVGSEPDKKRGTSKGESETLWDMSTPIFEQLLLAASRSPRRLKAIDDVIQQLRKEEGEDLTSNVVPTEFLDFWEAFKEIVPLPGREKTNMTTPPVNEHVERSLALLKDFQRATVKVVYDNLFRNGQQRMLVADEVGLGKTIVAKGVIARRIMDKIEAGDNTPLKVTYICSNQVIAHENVGKLDIYPDQRSHDRFASRLTYLAFEPEGDDEGILRLNTLTPATSFNKGSSTGQQAERRILYSLLMQDQQLSSHAKAVAVMMRAGVQKVASEWFAKLDKERDAPYGVSLRPCCHGRFLKAIKERILAYSECPLFEHLGIFKAISLYDAVVEFSKLLTLKNFGQFRQGSDHLVRELKDTLSEVCVEYIDADIYILDEFQRFKELVNQDSESEAAEIARRIFGKEHARILLLSATPFKAYTGDSPWESGEEHYKEFRTILRFLFKDDASSLKTYESHRQSLFKQLLELTSETGDIDTTHRDAVQQVLRQVMCRTERLSVSDDFNAMTVDKWQRQPLNVSAGDVQNFIATDNVVQFLNATDTKATNAILAPIEFCKSAPFPLSFLDGYKLKQQLRARRKRAGVQKELRANRNAWIDHRKVHRYKLNFQQDETLVVNAKLAQVMEEVLDRNGERLLWVPPSLPCYPLAGSFAKSMGFSKTLIFSAWLMVPRMLSSLISYEVERRTIGDPESIDPQEKEGRKYFHTKNEKRHPIPQLVFSQKKSEDGETANNMSNFALLYPSRTLARVFDPKEAFVQHRSLDELRNEVAARIDKLIEDADLKRFGSPTGEADRWYWAAPLLLDHHKSSLRNKVKNWLESDSLRDDSDFFDSNKQESSSKAKHFGDFARCFRNPSDAGLGLIPSDLGQVLAEMAMASPAIAALRSVSCQFKTRFYERTLFAFDLATEFVSLFNKPESIAVVRLSTEPATYWRRVLRYCVDGCLQSVLDEFFHLLRPDCPTIWELYNRLADSMNLGTSSIKVDDLSSFIKNKRRNMRCHYAVDFGNQRMETEDGKNRIKGIRNNFNSPFRPFVLATTSIGQEGLDFHTYCRKLVHWNLPGNPIDLEQREGRINRFKGLVIRQQIASKYGSLLDEKSLNEAGVWDALFDIAGQKERNGTGKCEMIPFWHVETDLYQIERIIPFYPFSRDRAKLSSLLKTLAVYRLAFGQPRQAELVEHLLTNISKSRIGEIRDKLMIDLSPINYGDCTR